MKTLRDAPPSPELDKLVREWKARPENQFDGLPFDQQIVRLKHTVDYLVRRCEQAEASLVIADTTAANLHSVIRDRDAALREALEVLHNCGQVEAHDRIAALAVSERSTAARGCRAFAECGQVGTVVWDRT